ncbi:MAG: phosphotriesterase family protein [Acidimicrobiia bacterium]
MTVRTVRGDVPAEALGRTLVHEHLILDSALIRETMPHIHLHSVDDAVTEVSSCHEVGIGAMVDAMPAAGGRDPIKLAAISEATGVHIIATTGLHTPKYYGDHPWAVDINPSSLAQLFVDDIEVGIDANDHMAIDLDRTTIRAGIIKVATDEQGIDERAIRLFEAAVEAAQRTHTPILTHTEDGIGALDQIALFERLGFSLNRVVLSHTDKIIDPEYHEAILATGVSVEYDQALRRIESSSNATSELIVEMVHRGYARQMMLGTDGARRSLWKSLGGSPGLAFMSGDLVDDLVSRGLEQGDLVAIFEDNPQRFLDRGTEAA